MSSDSGNFGSPSGTFSGEDGDLPLIPLFPLPNVVLFPKAVLPLHIFEERYRAMTRHALEGDGLIGMALLRPGWEKCYYAKPAIDPVICVGSIVSHERLPDGKYNFLLQGLLRGRVRCEVNCESYRLARVSPIVEVPAPAVLLRKQRKRLIELFTEPPFAGIPLALQFAKLLASKMPTPAIADLAAYNFLEDVQLKQALLGEADVATRVNRTVQALEGTCCQVCTDLSPTLAGCATAGSQYRNPSLN